MVAQFRARSRLSAFASSFGFGGLLFKIPIDPFNHIAENRYTGCH